MGLLKRVAILSILCCCIFSWVACMHELEYCPPPYYKRTFSTHYFIIIQPNNYIVSAFPNKSWKISVRLSCKYVNEMEFKECHFPDMLTYSILTRLSVCPSVCLIIFFYSFQVSKEERVKSILHAASSRM